MLGLGKGTGYRQPTKKDGGVDVVAWRPFRDKRAGFVTVLAQCTVRIDWVDKARDIVPDLWTGYIDFGKSPITSLVVPFAIPRSFERWDELRRTVWLVIDRLRLCELLEKAEIKFRDDLQSWFEKETDYLRN